MNRFYKSAAAAPVDGGFAVQLDGRPVRTPGKALVRPPTAALAAAIAAEWDAQGDQVRPETMPLTRLANVAIDRAPETRADLIAHIGKYGPTDLLCHRAERPAALVERQAALWDPLLDWAAQALDAPLSPVAGVIARPQPAESLRRLTAQAAALNDFALTGLAHAAGLSGSAVIAYAMAKGRLTGSEAFEAANVDDLFQLATWGEDEEARARLEGLRGEFLALERWFRALA